MVASVIISHLDCLCMFTSNLIYISDILKSSKSINIFVYMFCGNYRCIQAYLSRDKYIYITRCFFCRVQSWHPKIFWLQLHCYLLTWYTWNSAIPEGKVEKEGLMYSTILQYNAANMENKRVLTIFTLLFLCFAFIFLISVTIWVYKVCGKETKTCTLTNIPNLTLFGEKYKCTRGFSLPVFHSITKETKNKQNKKSS